MTEVVQVYAEKNAASVVTLECKLIEFQSISLETGRTATVAISLDLKDFAYYDGESGWIVAHGTNAVSVGRSIQHIQAVVDIEIRPRRTRPLREGQI